MFSLETIQGVLCFLGGLGLFLYGIRLMSDGIRKRAGRNMRRILKLLTRNRFLGVLTGFTSTAVIQSSSATSVLLVTLVNVNLIAVAQAIPVIMGANIGTTVTIWFISFLGFKFEIASFALPAIAIGTPLFFSKQERHRETAAVILGFGLLFLGLQSMKDAVPSLEQTPEILRMFSHHAFYGYYSVLLGVIVGTIATMVIQSSSAAMAATIAMASQGWIPFEVGCGIVLGENIGTTITAYLATIPMGRQAKQTARAHFIFNIIGVIWMLILFHPFVHFTDWLIPGDLNSLTPESELKSAISIHLAAFHSLFNLINTSVLISFVTPLEKLTSRMVKEKPEKDENDAQMIFGFMPINKPQAIESNLITIRRELGEMAERVCDALLTSMNAQIDDDNDFKLLKDQVTIVEQQTDQMRTELTNKLNTCMLESLDTSQAARIQAMLLITVDLESMADSIENVMKLIERKRINHLNFHSEGVDQLVDFTSFVYDFLRFNADCLCSDIKKYEFDNAMEMEETIDSNRDRLRSIARSKLAKGANIQAELIFIDMLRHLEHVGDYSLGIAHSMKNLEENWFGL
jgi:phosphate:Na+ symporter